MSERDERLRKLEPKIGKTAARALWLGGLDPKIRKHTDPLIGALSDSVPAENYRSEKVLLPPPSISEVHGTIDAGQVWYDGPRGRLGLETRELVKHTGILGASGSGKTSLAMQIVRSVLLSTDVRIVVFDVKRTWRSLVAYLPEDLVRIYTLARPDISPFTLNFLIPPEGLDPLIFDKITTTIADEVLYGGLGSHSVAQIVTAQLRRLSGTFTMLDMHLAMQQMASGFGQRKRAGDWWSTAMRITAELASPPLGYVINWHENVMEKELETARLVIFEMEFFSQPQFQYFVTSFLVREYLKRLGAESRDQLDLLIVFEEAGRIFNASFPQPQFYQVLRECRETGIGILWIDQSADEVQHTAWANTNTLFVGKQISSADISRVGAAIAFERPRERLYVSRLGTGEFVVRLPDRYRFPFLVRTADFKKVSVPDEKVKALMAPHLERLGILIPASTEGFAAAETKEPPLEADSISRGIKRKEKDQTATTAGRTPTTMHTVLDQGPSSPVLSEARLAGGPGLRRPPELPWAAGSQRPSSPGGLEDRETGTPWVPGRQERTGSGIAGNQGKPRQPGLGQPANQFASKAEELRACQVHLLARILEGAAKPVTYLYSELGLSKAKGTKVKKMLLEAGLASEQKTTENGRVEVRLKPTGKARPFMETNRSLLARPLVRWQTKRFGGRASQELSELAVKWAESTRQVSRCEREASDGFGGKWDLLCESPQGGFVIEVVTGESKGHEALHVQKARAAGLPIFCFCKNENTRERIRRYLRDQNIEEDEGSVAVVTAQEAFEGVQETGRAA